MLCSLGWVDFYHAVYVRMDGYYSSSRQQDTLTVLHPHQLIKDIILLIYKISFTISTFTLLLFHFSLVNRVDFFFYTCRSWVLTKSFIYIYIFIGFFHTVYYNIENWVWI